MAAESPTIWADNENFTLRWYTRARFTMEIANCAKNEALLMIADCTEDSRE